MRNYVRKVDKIDPRRGDRIALELCDIKSYAALPAEIFDPIAGAFMRWFVGGDDKPMDDARDNAVLMAWKIKQSEAVRRYIESCNGKSGDRGKPGKDMLPHLPQGQDMLPHVANVNVKISDKSKVECDGAASHTLCLSASVISILAGHLEPGGMADPVPVAYAENLVKQWANSGNVTTNGKPVTQRTLAAMICKWWECERHREEWTKPTARRVDVTGKDWTLCAERCAHCTGTTNGCSCGVKVPPPSDPQHARPPEECARFKPKQTREDVTA